MAIVATVVVVGVLLLRRPLVKRGRWRWGGVIRRRILVHGRTILPGVLFIILGPCGSTPTTQTSPAPAPENVSAPLFAHPGPTKTKPGSPRANYVKVALTKTKLGVHRAKNVIQANTMTKPAKHLNRLLVKTIATLDRILTPTKVPV